MAEPLLHGLRVLELPGLGAACGRFLATLGAQVVKLEPPGGEPARRRVDGAEDPAWTARNLGKRSVVADLEAEAGRALEVVDIGIRREDVAGLERRPRRRIDRDAGDAHFFRDGNGGRRDGGAKQQREEQASHGRFIVSSSYEATTSSF